MKFEVEWNESVIVYRETAYTVIESTGAEIECWFRIVFQDENHGYFEWGDVETCGEDWYCEGGLWFDGDELTDFDGVFDLCEPIRRKLILLGYKLD